MPGGLSPRQLAEIESQWCSHGSQQEGQQMASLMAGLNPSDSHEIDRLQATLDSWPSTHARRAVSERLRDAWQQALRARGDEASLALAWLVMAGPQGRPGPLSLQALQDLATRSTHPFVQAAALHWRSACQAATGCRPAPAERWPQLDPDNLAAWVSAAPNGLPDAPLLQRWQRARHWDDGSAYLMRTLVELPWPEQPGLAQEMAIRELKDWGAAWAVADARLFQRCAQAEDRPDLLRVCGQAAELLWNKPVPSALDWVLATQLASRAGLASQAPWPARSAAVQAAQAGQAAKAAADAPGAQPGDRCAWQQEARAGLRHWAAHGELAPARPAAQH